MTLCSVVEQLKYQLPAHYLYVYHIFFLKK